MTRSSVHMCVAKKSLHPSKEWPVELRPELSDSSLVKIKKNRKPQNKKKFAFSMHDIGLFGVVSCNKKLSTNPACFKKMFTNDASSHS